MRRLARLGASFGFMRLLVLALALVGLGARLAACDGWVHTAIEGGGACARVLADGVFNTWFATLPTTQVYPRTVAQSAFQSAMARCHTTAVPCHARARQRMALELLFLLWTVGSSLKIRPIQPADQAACRPYAWPGLRLLQCSPATRPGELGTSRGGVKNFGITVGDSVFPFARSLEEAQRRHGTYRCAVTLMPKLQPASPALLPGLQPWVATSVHHSTATGQLPHGPGCAAD